MDVGLDDGLEHEGKLSNRQNIVPFVVDGVECQQF
jgi:hypothetical protein